MDTDRFDALTRALAAGRSRRDVLKALAGGALAAMAGVVGGGQTEAAKTCRSVGNACDRNGNCCSHSCVKERRTRKICHCQSTADCPASTNPCRSPVCTPDGSCATTVKVGAACDDGDACTQGDACDARGVCVGGNPVVCPTAGDVCVAGACCTPEAATTTCAGQCGPTTNNCGQMIDCGGVGAPCTVTYYSNIPGEDPPIGFPGIGCCAGLVCQGSPFPLDAPKPGSCQVNRAPTALPFDKPFPWKQDCFPVTMAGLDPDNNPVLLQVVTPPTNGIITEFVPNMAPAAGSFASAAPGVRALHAFDYEHICLDGGLPDEPNDGLGDAGNIPLAFANNAPQFQCAEGTYFYHTLCYVPFSPTFTGNDSFSFTATDIFGAVSAPAIFTITIFNPS